jgi:hypothetical protein
MKEFFKTIPRSVYNPAFYGSVIKEARLARAFGYFFVLIALIALVGGVLGSFTFERAVDRADVAGIVTRSVEKYPADYTLSFMDGVASSSANKVIRITSEDLGLKPSACAGTTAPCTLLTIDTSRNPSVDEVMAADSYAWIAKEYVYVKQADGRVEAQSIKQYGNFTITKARAQQLGGYLLSFLGNAQPYMAVLIGAFAFLALLFYIPLAAILALILLALSKVKERDYSYKGLFAAALYATSLPVIVGSLALLATLPVPSMFTQFLALIILLVNFLGIEEPEQPEIEASSN